MITDFETLKGKTLVEITINKRPGKNSCDETALDDFILFVCDDGQRFELSHIQDCCEYVWLSEVIGDISDLIGYPLLVADVSSSEEREYGTDGKSWTFYKLATIKGSVDLRWCGSSNGYYSEAVNFIEITNGPN